MSAMMLRLSCCSAFARVFPNLRRESHPQNHLPKRGNLNVRGNLCS